MPRIAILSGSPTYPSRLTGILEILAAQLKHGGAEVEFIQVRDLPPEDLIYARFGSPDITKANALVEKADAIIVGSPVYKASFTGLLKTYLDLLPQKALAGKAILPIMIGGSYAHLLALDYALKPVLSALGGRNIHTGVYAVENQVIRPEGGDGTVQLEAELEERLQGAIHDLLANLPINSPR
jgi:FMN reductase